MGKKSKKKGKEKKKSKKTLKYRGLSNKEERIKSITSIKAPDEDPFRLDNDKLIDRFLRFNRRKTDKLPKKKQNRLESKN